MKRKLITLLSLLAAAALLAACSTPEGASLLNEEPVAITDGQLDGVLHPHVGIMVQGVFDADGNLLTASRCSGTLIDPKIYLTAGHCFDADTNYVGVWFESDLTDPATRRAVGWPFASEIQGDWMRHPSYDENAFFLYDLGVVILDEPVFMPDDRYGELPTAGQLDELKPGRRTTFTPVGYGLQAVTSAPDTPNGNNSPYSADLERRYARPHLVQINTGFVGDFSILLSNNHATGGTCFGDSGGPNFLGGLDSDLIAGVTSFGLNGSCGGTGGVYRIDKQVDLDWVQGIVDTYGYDATN